MGQNADPTDAVIAPKMSGSARWALIAALIFALSLAGLYWRKHAINGTVENALVGETDAETNVYRRNLLSGNDIVFDVKSAGGDMSAVAMTRRLLKTAEALQDREFHRVYLASAGTEKFFFEGSYFKRLGAERELQNPIYTIRTMPENVFNVDGTPAFGTWTGGWLGVIGKQFEDNNEFHRKWWMDDTIAALP